FMTRLPQHDAAMRQRYESARSRGNVLRYVAKVTADGQATVGLIELDARHAFANIALTDNVVRYATHRYCDNPLIVQGPGAGPEVTAGGVFADLLRLAAYLGAQLLAPRHASGPRRLPPPRWATLPSASTSWAFPWMRSATA